MRKFILTYACAGLLGAALSGPAYSMGPMAGVMGMGIMGVIGAMMGGTGAAMGGTGAAMGGTGAAMGGTGAAMDGTGAMTDPMDSGDSRHQVGEHPSGTRSTPATPMNK